MDIKIGDKPFKTRKPGDLDAALRETTGCNAAETAQQLGGYPNPGRIASALRPFLPDDAPSMPELAHMIAVADDIEILAAVRKLYGSDAVTPPAATKADG